MEEKGKKKETEKPEKEATHALEEMVTRSAKEWQNLSGQAARLAEYHDRLLRLGADFANFRKRAETERQQLAIFVESSIVSRFLPILDCIEQTSRFSGQEENKESLTTGLKLIVKEVRRALEDLGLKPLEISGKIFDPHYAEVVEVREDKGCPEGTVLSILRTGYLYKDQILRPALVVISKQPADAQDGSSSTGKD